MLTKIFLGFKQPKPLNHSTAWGCLISNLLVLPGLGTLVAGKKSGIFQAVLALVGVLLSMVWAVSFVKIWWSTRLLPWDGGPDLRMGIIGVFLFLISWVWALMSSISILRSVTQK